MTGEERNKLNEKIRFSYYRQRGYIPAVMEDLKKQGVEDVDEKYVRGVVNALRKKIDGDIKAKLAELIMGSIWEGFNSLETVMHHKMMSLENYLVYEGSMCCSAPVYRRMERVEPHPELEDAEEKQVEVTRCGNCGKPVFATQFLPNLGVYKMMAKFDENIRKHYEQLTEFAKSMGFVVTEPQPVIKQNNIIFQNQIQQPDRKQLDSTVIQDLDNITPIQQHHLARELEKRIAEDDEERQDT